MVPFEIEGAFFSETVLCSCLLQISCFPLCRLQFLDVARTLEGYGTVVFPHCACDARKSGHVIVSISLNSFRLQACSDQGDKEVGFT